MFKKYVACILISLNILLLFSCSVKTIFKNYDDVENEVAIAEDMYYETTANKQYSPMALYQRNDALSMGATADVTSGTESSDRKIIKKYDINAESREIEKTINELKQRIASQSGIIDESTMSNWNSKSDRHISMTVRIPSKNTDTFLNFVNGNLNVTYFYESAQDITDTYDDSLSRLETYKNEEKRLNELIEKATKVEDLISIEDRLSNVRYQIESITKRLNNFDKQVDYTTFNISISEVKIFTEKKETMPTRDTILERFRKNFEDTKLYLVNIGIYLFVHIPAICLCLVVILIILLIIFLISKRYKKKNAKSNDKSKKNDIKKDNQSKEENKLNNDYDKFKEELTKREETKNIKVKKVDIVEETNEDNENSEN